jgi:hypothetical protein
MPCEHTSGGGGELLYVTTGTDIAPSATGPKGPKLMKRLYEISLVQDERLKL